MIWFPFSSFFRKSKPGSATNDGVFHPHANDFPRTGRGRQKEHADDSTLPEKKRARRRLVGAIALTLGLVIVLPMVFDAEPKPLTDDIVIRIPSKDKPAEMNPASRPAAALASAAQKTEPEPAPVEPVAAAKPAAGPAAKTQVAPVAPANAKPAVANVTKPDAKRQDAKHKDSEPKQDAKHEPKPAAKPAAEPAKNAPAEGKVVIQVAALTSPQKVAELQTQLKTAGIKSYTQKVSTAGGERIRVRVGPFGSKSEAQQACAKLSKMRLTCTLLPG